MTIEYQNISLADATFTASSVTGINYSSKAFDGLVAANNFWATATPINEWIAVSLDSPSTKIAKLFILVNGLQEGYYSRNAKVISIQAQTTRGGNWDNPITLPIAEIEGGGSLLPDGKAQLAMDNGRQVRQAVIVENNIAYPDYRLFVHNVWGGDICIVTEIELWESIEQYTTTIEAKFVDGKIATLARVHNHATGEWIADLTPDATSGRCPLNTTVKHVDITIFKSGYRPLTHGPIELVPLE